MRARRIDAGSQGEVSGCDVVDVDAVPDCVWRGRDDYPFRGGGGLRHDGAVD